MKSEGKFATALRGYMLKSRDELEGMRKKLAQPWTAEKAKATGYDSGAAFLRADVYEVMAPLFAAWVPTDGRYIGIKDGRSPDEVRLQIRVGPGEVEPIFATRVGGKWFLGAKPK